MINTQMKLLRYTVFSAGLLGMTLRALLYATAIDAKGLLAADHWATWTILILTGLMLVLLGIGARNPQGPKDYKDCFPASLCQGATSLFLGGVIAFRTLSHVSTAGDSLELAASVSGIAACTAMAVAGICRFTGKQPSFLCHSALCIFLALQMVSQYRRWSADPQLIDYCFYLLAFVCLMLTAYFLAGFDANLGSRRGVLFFSMASGFFCLLALPESGDAGFLAACALWAFCCGPQNQAKPRRHRPVMVTDEENTDDHT